MGKSKYWFWLPRAIQGMYLKAGTKENDHTLAKIPLVADPGTKYLYSVSYDVLGRVIEVTSGMQLNKFFEERIYKPLEMNGSGFQVKESDVNRLVYMDPKDIFYSDPTRPAKYIDGSGGYAYLRSST